MIKSLKFTGGYAVKIKNLTKTFTFTEGVNVLVGRNGSGKSTIIEAIARYGFTRAGWTTWDWCLMGGLFDFDRADKPTTLDTVLDDYFSAKKHGTCTAEVVMDGPVFFGNEESYDGSGIALARSGIGGGALSAAESLLRRFNSSTQSQGETRRDELNSLISRLNEYPFEMGKRPDGDEKRSLLYDHIESTLSHGSPTLLLDEPERYLDLAGTIELYTVVIPAIAKCGFQVIVASHSPVAMLNKEFNLVDMVRGYSSKCKRELIDLIK